LLLNGNVFIGMRLALYLSLYSAQKKHFCILRKTRNHSGVLIMNRKTKIASAIGLVLGGAASYSGIASANLTSSATLSFTLGASTVVACTYGTSPPPCKMKGYNITDIVGSYFGMDTRRWDEAAEDPISSFNGIHLGTRRRSGRTPAINGTESLTSTIPGPSAAPACTRPRPQ
jgi:hypothetical protein